MSTQASSPISPATTDLAASLRHKLQSRTAQVGVVGLGYVGLPLAVELARAGFRAVGIDLDQRKVDLINQGESYIQDVSTADVARFREAGRLSATTDRAVVQELDTLNICVPTPLNKTKDPDLSYVVSAVEMIAEYLRPGQLVVLESTTYPGTTDEVVSPILERRGFKAGRDFFLAFSPERVDPGNEKWNTRNVPKVVGGMTPTCTELASTLYRASIDSVVPVSSPRVAEMVKLLENTFRSVNIALVNEVALMCDRLGLDVREVVGAAATKPFGFMAFQPGPGTGGHCIPLDPLYLSWKLRTLEYRARFVELADDVNLSMPRYVVARVVTALNDAERSLKGARVLVLGVAYKRDVDDTRESPSLEILRHLAEGGAQVEYADPYVPEVAVHGRTWRGVPLEPGTLARYDVVVVATDHRALPWDRVAAEARLVVDARGAVPRDAVRGVLWPLSGPPVRGAAAAAPAVAGARA